MPMTEWTGTLLRICLLAIYGVPYGLLAQPYWAHDLGGVGNEHIADVQVDTDGSIYVTGEYGGTVQFGGQAYTGFGGLDAFVARLAPDGSVLWLVRGGGSGIDRGAKLALGQGQVLAVTGEFMGSANLFGTTLSSAGATADVFVAVLDKSDGSLQWVRQGGGASGTDSPGGVSISPDGQVVVVGEFRGLATWDGEQLTSMTGGGGQPSADVFIACYAANGDLLWLKQGAAPADDTAVDVVHDPTGGLYVAGRFSQDITFDQTYTNVLVNAGFLLRLDASGGEVWFRRFGGATFNHVRDIAMDGASRVILAGDLQGTMVWSGPPTVNVAGGEPFAYFLLAVGADGSLAGQATVGSVNNVSVGALAVADGSLCVLGEFECGFADLAAHYGANGLFMATGSGDLFVARHALPGLVLQDAQQFGGRSGKEPGGIGIMPGGDPVFSGSFQFDLLYPSVASFNAEISTNSGTLIGNGVAAFCDDPSYGMYAGSLSAGLFDGFIARGHVQGREPYDWWRRDGAGCDRSELDPCIRGTATGPCQDTITACGNALLRVDKRFSHHDDPTVHYLGPQVQYLWSTGATGPTLPVTASGTYWVTLTSLNGCWQWTDSVVVVIHPLPAAPLLHDDVTINSGTSFPEMIPLCDPETHWVWATNVQPGATFWWNYPLSGGTQLYNDSIVVDTTGTYTFSVMNEFGCIRSVTVYVEDHPYGPMPDLDLGLGFFFEQDLDQNDTVSVCTGTELEFTYVPIWTIDGVPVDELPPGVVVQWNIPPADPTLPTPGGPETGSFDVDGPGWYVAEVVLLVHNAPCGEDSLYFTGSDSIYVEVFPPVLIDVALTGPDVVCDGDTIVLSAACTGCGTIEWSGPDGAPSGPWDLHVWGGGVYTVTATIEDTNGCSYTDSDSIAVLMPVGPVLTVDPTDGILCPGSTATLSTPLNGSGHIWYGPQGPITGQGGTYTTDVPGEYFLTMIVDGCSVTSNSVALENYGTPYIAFGEPPVLCHPGDQVTLTVAVASGAVVTWGAPLSGNAHSQVIDAPGTYTCSVTACGITTPLSIEVPYAPVTAELIGSGPFNLCPGDSLLLQAAAGADTYLWLPDSVTGPEFLVNGPGDVWLVVTNTEGCSDTSAVVPIGMVEFPVPLTVTGDTVCAGEVAQLLAAGSGSMVWYADPFFTTPLGVGSPFNFVGQTDTVLYVRQEMDGCFGDSLAVPVEVIPLPEAVLVTGPDSLCLGDPLVLVVIGPDTVQYQWSTPVGQANGPLLDLGPALADHNGVYSCVPFHQGCPGPPAVHVVQVNAPQELDLPEQNSFCAGATFTIALPAGYTNVQWSNGSTSSSITLVTSASLEVAANDVHGCPVAAAMVVEATDCDVIVPNVFTPNGDGSNETWLPAGGFVNAGARIWNRWGGLVYEGDMLQKAWDGKHYVSGERCTDGVYYYELELIRSDGSVEPLAGYVHLLH